MSQLLGQSFFASEAKPKISVAEAIKHVMERVLARLLHMKSGLSKNRRLSKSVNQDNAIASFVITAHTVKDTYILFARSDGHKSMTSPI